MSDEEDSALALAGEASQEIRREAGGGALEPLDRRSVGEQRRRDRDHLLGPGHVAGGRGDADEGLEFALRTAGDGLRRRVDPRSIKPAHGYNLSTTGGELDSTWSQSSRCCESRIRVGLVKHPRKTIIANSKHEFALAA